MRITVDTLTYSGEKYIGAVDGTLKQGYWVWLDNHGVPRSISQFKDGRLQREFQYPRGVGYFYDLSFTDGDLRHSRIWNATAFLDEHSLLPLSRQVPVEQLLHNGQKIYRVNCNGCHRVRSGVEFRKVVASESIIAALLASIPHDTTLVGADSIAYFPHSSDPHYILRLMSESPRLDLLRFLQDSIPPQ